MKRILFIIALLLFTTPALAEVVIQEKNEYYSVPGTSKNEIIKQMKRRSPFKDVHGSYPAFTRSEVQYQYSWTNRGGRCSVKDVKVIANITYVYPKLVQHPNRSVRSWWDDTMDKYVIHEEIHGDITKRWAHTLDRELRSLTDLNCGAAKQTIKSRAQYIMRQMKKKQKEYDRITDHGRLQHKYTPPR